MSIHTVTQVRTSTRTLDTPRELAPQPRTDGHTVVTHGRSPTSRGRGTWTPAADDQCERRPQESTRAARDSSPGFPLVFRRGPTTRRHSELSDDAPPPRRDDRDAERRAFFFPFFAGHIVGILQARCQTYVWRGAELAIDRSGAARRRRRGGWLLGYGVLS